MKRLLKKTHRWAIVVIVLIALPLIFNYGVNSQARSLANGQIFYLLVTNYAASIKVAQLKFTSGSSINLYGILYNHFYCNVWGTLLETAPHIILITKNRSWLWSMHKMQFIEYKTGNYHTLNSLDKSTLFP